jgi:hypothetical protein
MSAFVVEDKIINRVVTFISNTGSKQTIKDETGIDIGTFEGCELLGKAMFELNCNAVEQRYGAGEAKEFRDLDYGYRPSVSNAVQVYKSLRCWLYQCSEGNVPERLLYATMERVSDQLAHHIVSELKAYDKAEW